MAIFLDVPDDLVPVADAVAEQLLRVQEVFDAQLASDLPPVQRLVKHIEGYRGKMLRPALVLLCGMACHPKAAGARWDRAGAASLISRDHLTVAAVCEMVHMATLVHDDILDEAEVRRRAKTVNGLHGNEAAVMLGDYLIAGAYHLCASLPTPDAARAVGKASMVLCAGELLQLHHREDYSLDEATYLEILDRKTAELIACAAELGAGASGASLDLCGAAGRFGRLLGVAFQIQDDLLDLLGEEAVVGKSVRKDLEKGKLTLPLVRYLRTASEAERGEALRALEAVRTRGDGSAMAQLARRLRSSGAVDHARDRAEGLAAQAAACLDEFPRSPAREVLARMAEAAVARSY